MNGAYTRRDIGRPLTLRTARGAGVAGRLREVEIFAPTGGERTIVVSLEVDLPTFQRIEDEAFFGFTQGSIDPQAGQYRFVSEKPVVLHLGLDPSKAGESAAPDLETALDQVASALAGNDGPLTAADSYRWFAAMQEMPARPGVTAMRGIRSIHDTRP